MDVSKDRKIEMLKQLILIRRFEEKVKVLYNEGAIPGAIHLCIGQEAVAVGVCQVLRTDDYILSTHRGHGHAIAKGCDLKHIMAELFGKKTGLSGGHGGSMHLYDTSKGLMGGNGIVGGGIPLALGAAFSAQYRSTDQVSVAFFSDGAVNQGTFGESLNLAALFELPVIFICENNRYAATTPVSLSTAKQDITRRAGCYGVKAVFVDGNDVIEVYSAVSEAVDHTRMGKGPSFIECRTYRMEPHCGIIPDQREKGEREAWIEKDPLKILKDVLIKDDLINEKDVIKMEKEVSNIIEQAVEFARNSPWPDIESERNASCII